MRGVVVEIQGHELSFARWLGWSDTYLHWPPALVLEVRRTIIRCA